MTNLLEDFPDFPDPPYVKTNANDQGIEPAFWAAVGAGNAGVWKPVEDAGTASLDGNVTGPFPDSGRWLQMRPYGRGVSPAGKREGDRNA